MTREAMRAPSRLEAANPSGPKPAKASIPELASPRSPEAAQPSKPEAASPRVRDAEARTRIRHWHPAVPGPRAAVPAARRLVGGAPC